MCGQSDKGVASSFFNPSRHSMSLDREVLESCFEQDLFVRSVPLFVCA